MHNDDDLNKLIENTVNRRYGTPQTEKYHFWDKLNRIFSMSITIRIFPKFLERWTARKKFKEMRF